MTICIIAMFSLIIGVKSANLQENAKPETLKFERFENQKFESNLTSIQTYDQDVGGLSQEVQMNQTEDVNRGSYEKRIPLSLPSETDGSFKTYMSYKTITNVNSDQYQLQQQAYTDEYGFRRVDDAYCIALGSAYGSVIGTRYKISLNSGIEFIGILADCKQDVHTDDSNRYVKKNGNLIEFIVAVDQINEMSMKMGDMSYSNLQGRILKIERMIE